MNKPNAALFVVNLLVIVGYIVHLHQEDPFFDKAVAKTLVATVPFLVYTFASNKISMTAATSAFIAYVILDNERVPVPKTVCKLSPVPVQDNVPVEHVFLAYGYTKDDHWRFLDQLSCLLDPMFVVIVPDVFSDPESDVYIEQVGDKDYFTSLGQKTTYSVLRPETWGPNMCGAVTFDPVSRFANSGARIKAAFQGGLPTPSLIVNDVIKLAEARNCEIVYPST